MLIMTPIGLYCPAGDFYIDPKVGVDHAVITHAHSDHARGGSKQYYCTFSGANLLRARLGKNISLHTFPYQNQFDFNNVRISFHPAGHILGSSQVRLELDGEVWVVSGDYKRDFDPTCEPFENVFCDVFITEATFGTPAFSWDKSYNPAKSILSWWDNNILHNFNSVLFAYSLGKAQRILGMLAHETKKIIYCHPATEILNQCYRDQGILLASTMSLRALTENSILEHALILAPHSFLKTKYTQFLGNRYKTAFASGWVKKNSPYHKEGFVISDHADWNDLLITIEQTKAKRVYVQHRSGALIKELKKRGINAFSDIALFPKNPNQLCLF